jgi:uncharacterized membrane protein YccC
MTESAIRFFKSFDFSKGIVLTLAIVIVIVISLQWGYLEIGISIATGVLISAPADVAGSMRHRIIGILVATFLAVVATIVINFASINLWLLIPVLGTLIFLIAFISVYGFRASLVSLSGLLAIVLSFAHPKTGADIFVHAGLIGLGGLWYLFFSHFSHLLIHRRHTEQLMAECIELTAKYLKTRGELALEEDEQLQKQLFELQTEINAKHETLREILLSSRRKSGHSNFLRRQVLIFIELIDILELAIGNLATGHKINEIFEKHPEKVKPFIDLIFEMARQLDYLSKVLADKKPLQDNKSIDVLLRQAEQSIVSYKEEVKFPEAGEGVLLLQNIYDYLQKQAQKIEVIRKVMNNLISRDQMWLWNKDSEKFITQQDYNWKVLSDNLSFKSPIFKHSLRLTITVLVGYAIGHIFSVQNAYWILLTIIVIMRPGYALTKQRSKHRLYGTLIGGTIAVGVVFITQSPFIYGTLAIITLILAFGLVQKNYKSSAIFITLNIVFVYALLRPDVLNVIQFRILDTLTGAAFAIIANTFFWPSWEFLSIHGFIGETINANRLYLKEIDNFYHHKNYTDPSYKLSRKGAFLAIGNLNAAFQRMTQEPVSRQKNLAKIYEIVVLNHTFLSLSASLGTYIRHHKTTAASRHFERYIASICNNLEMACQMLDHKEISDGQTLEEINEAQNYLDNKYRELIKQGTPEPSEGVKYTIHPELQELKLISDQLKWLYTISDNMKNVMRSL